MTDLFIAGARKVLCVQGRRVTDEKLLLAGFQWEYETGGGKVITGLPIAYSNYADARAHVLERLCRERDDLVQAIAGLEEE